MTTNGHTPGPWKVFYTASGQTIIGIGEATGEGVTDCGFGLWRSGPERDANACLIAAAPDMLAALKDAAKRLRGAGMLSETDEIVAAISKAEGQP